MMQNPNCIYNNQQAWCKNKNIKRSLWGLGARVCRLVENEPCSFQIQHPGKEIKNGKNVET
jgi:hypothetical protein